ncbi:MAG: MFS transporter [Verrucomicrobiaceae bacterium]|nr:MFS transporter [Verrucomicrobiaceae bacterium]
MDTQSSQEPPGWKRGFWSLFVVQFQGAFSDNVFKYLVIFMASAKVAVEVRDQYISVVLAIFALPFILFAMAGGYCADRYRKRTVVVYTKVLEVAVMVLGVLGLFLQNLPLLLIVVFLMSVQSAFFGPSKYSLLPEMLPEPKLSWGNGILSLGTFMAIITGGIVAGVLSDRLASDQTWMAGLGLVGLAVLGLTFSRGILNLPAAAPEKKFRLNFFADIWTNLQGIRGDRVLLLAISGSVYFWFLAALFGDPTILVYSKDLLHLNDTEIGIIRACLAVGIGVGSAAAGFLSGRKIEYGLVPLGAMGLAMSAALLGIPGLTAVHVGILLALLGFSGGFYMVPLNALIQHRPDAKNKGSVIATESWLTSVGIFVASGAFWLMKTQLALAPTTIFLVGAAVTLVATIYAMWLVPDSLVRLILWILTHTFYRVRVEGRENIPERGGALFVCNHLSMMDACFLIASTDRHIRFIMYQGIYDKWWVKPFAKMLKVIPISSEARPREMIKSLQAATEWIKKGEVVCIFAEGQITRIGQMLPFRRGMNRIMKGVDAPIVPVHLDNVWGSIFSFEKGRFYTKLPSSLPYPITVSYGSPLPPDAAPSVVRQAVGELGAAAWELRKPDMPTLHRSYVKTARRHPLRFAMTDATSPRIGFFTSLMKTLFLGRRLKKVWSDDEMVGILLPPSVAGALVNHAAMLAGKVPVNLNYTLSSDGIASCIRQCGIQHVVTSDKFLSKLNLSLPVEAVKLEEIAAKPGLGEKLYALLMAAVFPIRLIEKALGSKSKRTIDDLATVIFSSGSTGEPKGVMLSHFNVVSNVQQINQVFAFEPDDRLLGVLPFFHSFGFTGTLGAPAVLGLGVAFHFNPTDSKVVGDLTLKNELTFLLATPTFLQIYMRGCQPEQFGSVRFIMVGAEKLPERLAQAFADQFGIRPMEAYGCTECSPAVSVNRMDFRASGFHQIGGKRGSIGHPLPGMTVRIVDPGTMEPVEAGQPGLMLLKGPNVMEGYLNNPEKTAEVLRDGWYTTGDIVAADEDGFLTITDRLSRFSKIGGEMVPHIKIEEKLHELAGVTTQTFSVTSVSDAKKGERLMVLHTLVGTSLDGVIEKLATLDLPNLWKPKRDQFVPVEVLPVLGTGKTDLRRVKEIALAAAANESV